MRAHKKVLEDRRGQVAARCSLRALFEQCTVWVQHSAHGFASPLALKMKGLAGKLMLAGRSSLRAQAPWYPPYSAQALCSCLLGTVLCVREHLGMHHTPHTHRVYACWAQLCTCASTLVCTILPPHMHRIHACWAQLCACASIVRAPFSAQAQW